MGKILSVLSQDISRTIRNKNFILFKYILVGVGKCAKSLYDLDLTFDHAVVRLAYKFFFRHYLGNF